MKYSLILKKLQMAYLEATLKQKEGKDVCMYCWKHDCDCHSGELKNDPFINLTEQIQYQ